MKTTVHAFVISILQASVSWEIRIIYDMMNFIHRLARATQKKWIRGAYERMYAAVFIEHVVTSHTHALLSLAFLERNLL